MWFFIEFFGGKLNLNIHIIGVMKLPRLVCMREHMLPMLYTSSDLLVGYVTKLSANVQVYLLIHWYWSYTFHYILLWMCWSNNEEWVLPLFCILTFDFLYNWNRQTLNHFFSKKTQPHILFVYFHHFFSLLSVSFFTFLFTQ